MAKKKKFNELTDPVAILQALAEYDILGDVGFLSKYKYRRSIGVFLHYQSREYDGKAVVGAAYGYQYPHLGPRSHTDLAGGEADAVSQLRALGFTVDYHPDFVPVASSSNFAEPEPSASRNPPWNREELILAFEAYVRWEGQPPAKTSESVHRLSQEIVALRHSESGNAEFRNSNGVYTKIMNFRRFDPAFLNLGKVGLARGGRLEAQIWNEFASDPSHLVRTADEIRARIAERAGSSMSTADVTTSEDLVDEAQFAILTQGIPPARRETLRELFVRNRTHVRELKKLYGGRCQVTGLIVVEGLAQDLTEVHHIQWLTRGGLDEPSNMIVVCPNIHAAIHATDGTLVWVDGKPVLVMDDQQRPLLLNKHLKKPNPSKFGCG